MTKLAKNEKTSALKIAPYFLALLHFMLERFFYRMKTTFFAHTLSKKGDGETYVKQTGKRSDERDLFLVL